MSKEKTFAEQVDESLNNDFPFYSSLKVCDTPQILLDVGCEQLPMLYTQRHLRDALKPIDEKNHHHGITLEQIKKMPMLISEPAMVFDSINRKDSIVLVTTEFDAKENPIIVSVKANGNGKYEVEELSSNFITSIYGRNNFSEYFRKIIDTNNLLFCDKEKSQAMFERWGEQYSELTNTLDFNTIIHKSNNIVNSFSEKKSDKSEDFCLFSVEIYGDRFYYCDKNCTNIDDLIKRYAECKGYYRDFAKNCEMIECGRYAELEQRDNLPKAIFSAEINVDSDTLVISMPEDRFEKYENIKLNFIHMNLSDALRYINDYGTIPKTDKEKIMMKCQSAEKWSETMNQRIEKELSPMGTEKGER